MYLIIKRSLLWHKIIKEAENLHHHNLNQVDLQAAIVEIKVAEVEVRVTEAKIKA